MFYTIINILKTPQNSLPIFKILFLKYLKGLFTKDKILISEIRSFLLLFFRLYLTKNSKQKISLGGGVSFNTFLELNLNEKIIINKLLNFIKVDTLAFVVLDISVNKAISLIEKDQLSGENRRFTTKQFKYFKQYLIKAFSSKRDD